GPDAYARRRPAQGREGGDPAPAAAAARPRDAGDHPALADVSLSPWPLRHPAGLAAGPEDPRPARYLARPFRRHTGADAAADGRRAGDEPERGRLRVPPAARLCPRHGPAVDRLE